MAGVSKDLRVLDLFCGMGGWSIGFHREGFDCIGVDTVDVGYPYDLILCDIRQFNPTGNYDVVVASPPCTEFSSLTLLSYKKGQRGPPEPARGVELVRETIRIIGEIQPRYWVIENVWGSITHLDPILGKPKLLAKPWILWGNYPEFDAGPKQVGDQKMSHSFEHHGKGGNVFGKGGGRVDLPKDLAFDPLRSWKRARIPVFLAQTLAKACRMKIQEFPKEVS